MRTTAQLRKANRLKATADAAPPTKRKKPLSPYLGDIPAEVWEVLERVWDYPCATKGDFARAGAQYIALAASMGWITVIYHDGHTFGNQWRMTISGQVALQHARQAAVHPSRERR